jgi:hypothetical protein
MALGLAVVALLWFVACLWAIISVLRSNTYPVIKLLWCLLILFFPIMGLLIWYVLGPRRGRRALLASDIRLEDMPLDELRKLEENLADLKRRALAPQRHEARTGDALRQSLDWNPERYKRS